VRLLEVPLIVPLIPQFVGDSPPAVAEVMTPLASRVNEPVTVPPEPRHVTPKTGSRIPNCTPLMVSFILVMFGSVPLKDAYLACHGSEAVRMVAEPLGQVPSIALVMYPIRAPLVFAIVLECNEPSRVTAHSVVPKPPPKLILANVPLSVWLEEESLPAVAVLVRAAKMVIAASSAVEVRIGLMSTLDVMASRPKRNWEAMAPLIDDAITLRSS
jgi:hypothetical protein